MVGISHVSTKFHFFYTQGYVIYNSWIFQIWMFCIFKKKVVWVSETILVKSHLCVKMKKKMEIKQHAHVLKTMALAPLWECYEVATCEMWERIKDLCIVANFLG
jgi:hypothetical protein